MEKSEAHVFAYQNHFDSLSGAAKACNEDFIADTFFGSAVVASACGCAGCFAHKTHAVDRCGITADTFYGSVYVFGNLFMPQMTMTFLGPKQMAATRLPVPSMLTMIPSSEIAFVLVR